MKIITAITPKGGGGKSTLLYCLAKHFHDKGHKVLVLDPDTNMSITKMYERRIDFVEEQHKSHLDYPQVLSFKPSPTKLMRQLEDFGRDYDFVFVDTYGKIERYHNDLLYIADLVLVPTQPNQAAINCALDACDYIDTVREENEGLPVYGVAMLNFARNGLEEREYRREFDDAFCFGVQTRPYGKAYKLADRRGLSVTELDSLPLLARKDKEACQNAAIDMRRLCKEVYELVEAL